MNPVFRFARSRSAILTLICVIHVGAQLIHWDAPFLRYGDGNLAFFGLAAHNTGRLGWSRSAGGILCSPGPESHFIKEPEAPLYNWLYITRPPLSLVLHAWVYLLLGDSEGVVRASLILIGLLSLLLFYGAARRFPGGSGGLLATAYFALNPMTLYFSTNTVHYTYALLFVTLAWYAAMRIHEGRRFRLLLYASVVLGCATDWPAYLSAAALTIFLWRESRSVALRVSLFALGSFSLLALHLWSMEPVHRTCLRYLFAAGAGRTIPPPVGEFLRREAREVMLYLTPGLVLAAAMGMYTWIRERRWRHFAFFLLCLEELVFQRLAFRNPFLTFFWAPVLALAADAGVRVFAHRPYVRFVNVLFLLLCIIPSSGVCAGLLTDFDDSMPEYRYGRAIGEETTADTRVLLVQKAAQRRVVYYYSDRDVSFLDPENLVVEVQINDRKLGFTPVSDLRQYLMENPRRFDVVVVAAEELTPDPSYASGYGDRRRALLAEPSPLRSILKGLASRESTRGPCVFYWLTP